MEKFSNLLSVVIPVYNEEATICEILDILLTKKEVAEIILIDDGSTDNTGSIIKKYAKEYEFIQYHYRKTEDRQEYFASNVFAIMEGYKKIDLVTYDFLAILDADIQLPENYYKEILLKFSDDSQLGVASGIYADLINGQLSPVLHDRRSTPKAIQVFRRKVFKEIGGFLPLKWGGEDTISCVISRMKGWKAWSFPDIKVVHLRPTGTGAVKNILSVRFRQGICEYNLATQPLFFLLKIFRRAILEKPYIIGSAARLTGFFWAALRQDKIILPKKVISFIRKEQLTRVFKGNKID